MPVPSYSDIILEMSGSGGTNETQASDLCKACGLCCTGHLFVRTKLRSAELDSAQALGLHVLGPHPHQRAFRQPCPLWQGQCTIYSSPHYPRFCRTYKCRLLKEVLEETTSLPEALAQVEQAKGMIHEVEALLPASSNPNFRERLGAELEGPKPGNEHQELREKAAALLVVYEQVFGVEDVVEPHEE